MIKDNRNPIAARIGVLLFVMGLILGLVSIKTNFNQLSPFIVLLWTAGLCLIGYGLTKANLKEDKEYSRFIRFFGKGSLAILLLMVIVPVLYFLSIVPFIFVMISLGVLLLVLTLLTDFLYLRTYQYTKRSSPQIRKEEKRKQMMILVICIILGLALWYFINYVILR